MTWKVAANFFGKHYTFYVVIISNLICFLSGTGLSWSSPIIPKLQNVTDDNPLGREITGVELSLIGSLSSAGGIVGPLIFGYFNDKIGRKKTITLIAVPYIIGYLLTTFGKVISFFYVSRVLVGMSLGGVFSILSIYLAEISDAKNRGTYSSMQTTFILIGILFSYSVGAYTSILNFNLILSILSICYVPLFYLTCTESPYFYLQTGQKHLALECLQKLRGTDDVFDELKDMENNSENNASGFIISIVQIFQSKLSIKVFTIVTTLLLLQQLSGINVIIAYSQNIFALTGSSLSIEISAIVVGAVQALTGLNTPLLSRFFGRKPMLIFSSLTVSLSQIVLGTFLYFKFQNYEFVETISWVPIVTFVVFIFFYNCGIGSLPWVISGELYPNHVKSGGVTLSTSCYWTLGFILNIFFDDMSKLGMDAMFWIFGSFCLVAGIFVFIFVPETKGKSLHDIQLSLVSNSNKLSLER